MSIGSNSQHTDVNATMISNEFFCPQTFCLQIFSQTVEKRHTLVANPQGTEQLVFKESPATALFVLTNANPLIQANKISIRQDIRALIMSTQDPQK